MDKKIQHFKKKGYELLTNYEKASKQQKKNYIRNAYCVFTELSFLEEDYQQIFKKPKLIIGKERSGKSFLAKNISFGFSNPVFLSGRDFIRNSSFRFSAVKDNTDLIVIDDVPAKDLMEVVLECTDSIYIERQCEVGYEIKSPQIIIDCVIDRQYIGASISRRVEIIETHIEEAEDDTPIFYAERLVDKK
jgi:AAA+ ATPase superfamily predicted ATPase